MNGTPRAHAKPKDDDVTMTPINIPFLKQIEAWYWKQPKVVRTAVFITFAAIAAIAAVRGITGDYAVYGRVWEKRGKDRAYARNYEVAYGDRYVGTNRHGTYYLVLSMPQYLGLLASGKLTLTISREDSPLGDHRVSFHRASGQLDPIEIEPNAPPPAASSPSAEHRPRWIVHAAEAVSFAPPRADSDRLFVGGLRIGEGGGDVSATLMCSVAGREVALLSSSPGNRPVASIPVTLGTVIRLEDSIYFPVPSGHRGVVEISVAASTGFLSKVRDRFRVPFPGPLGRVGELEGENGGIIRVYRLTPHDVRVFDKADLVTRKDALVNALFAAGFRVVFVRSPQGPAAETNALFAGRDVSLAAFQKVLGIVSPLIPLKTIETGLHLRSGNDLELQIGTNRAFEGRPALHPEAVARVLSCRTTAECDAVLSSIQPWSAEAALQ